jgi:hypothetical protein
MPHRRILFAAAAACVASAAAASAAAAAAAAAPPPLFAALAASRFNNIGTVNSSSRFAFQRIPAQYLEAENVSCAGCSWGDGGAVPYLFDVTGAAPANASCAAPPQPRDLRGVS